MIGGKPIVNIKDNSIMVYVRYVSWECNVCGITFEMMKCDTSRNHLLIIIWNKMCTETRSVFRTMYWEKSLWKNTNELFYNIKTNGGMRKWRKLSLVTPVMFTARVLKSWTSGIFKCTILLINYRTSMLSIRKMTKQFVK